MMIRIAVFSVLMLSLGILAAQEPQKKDNISVKTEKKDEIKKDSDSKEEEIDVQKTADRIADNAGKASERLKEKDPGAETKKIQDEIIKDIDSLIRKAMMPPPQMNPQDMNPMMPPPPMNSENKNPMNGMGSGSQSKMPMGGMGGSSSQSNTPMGGMKGSGKSNTPMGGMSSSSGGSQNKGSRRERREKGSQQAGNQKMGMGGMPDTSQQPIPGMAEPKDGQAKAGQGNDKDSKEPKGGFGSSPPKRKDDKFADLYRDVWGHLPERLRQEMDLYYRDQFMPRYSELLKQYYSAIAEQKKKGTDDK